LGDSNCALDPKFISDNGIEVIINCTPNVAFLTDQCSEADLLVHHKLENLRLPVYDSQLEKDFLLMQHYFTFILPYLFDKYTKENKTILIHCFAGKQRSAILVAALLKLLLDANYPMELQIEDANESLSQSEQLQIISDFIRSKRPQAFTFGYRTNFRKTYERFFNIN
jgi:hypothetical protein